MDLFIKKILFPISLFTAFFILALHCVPAPTVTSQNYTLKSYKNTVALYDGNVIINIYEDIVLNTLPQKDIQSFDQGIPFTTVTQAEIYLEDFE